MRKPRALAAVLLLLALPSGGCVERTFLIRSDPPGVPVRLNGIPVGRTPVEVPFQDYGVVRVETDSWDRDGDGLPEFLATEGACDLWAPWYQWFPLDFVSDNLWPGTLHVRREATLVLRPATSSLTEEGAAKLREAIPGLKTRAEVERAEEESHPPAPSTERPAEKPR